MMTMAIIRRHWKPRLERATLNHHRSSSHKTKGGAQKRRARLKANNGRRLSDASLDGSPGSEPTYDEKAIEYNANDSDSRANWAQDTKHVTAIAGELA